MYDSIAQLPEYSTKVGLVRWSKAKAPMTPQPRPALTAYSTSGFLIARPKRQILRLSRVMTSRRASCAALCDVTALSSTAGNGEGALSLESGMSCTVEACGK